MRMGCVFQKGTVKKFNLKIYRIIILTLICTIQVWKITPTSNRVIIKHLMLIKALNKHNEFHSSRNHHHLNQSYSRKFVGNLRWELEHHFWSSVIVLWENKWVEWYLRSRWNLRDGKRRRSWRKKRWVNTLWGGIHLISELIETHHWEEQRNKSSIIQVPNYLTMSSHLIQS